MTAAPPGAHRAPARAGRLGQAASGADLVVRNGRVFTGARPAQAQFCDAFAVRDGAIVATGTDAQMLAHATAGSVVLDAGGRTVIPGLIDSHIHLVRAGLTWTAEVRWSGIGSLGKGIGLLREAARRQPPGTWLRVVGGWHPGQLDEGRGPASDELTALFPDHPVYVQLLYEEAVLNDAGLRRCGITDRAEDPPGGSVERDAAGRPTGTVRGMGAFAHCLEAMPPPDFEDQVEGTRQAMAELSSHGVTGVIDAGGFGMSPEHYEPLFELWRRGGVSVRTRLYVGPLSRGRERAELSGWMRHLRPGFGDEWLRHVGIGEITVFGCHDLEGLAPFSVDASSSVELEAILREAALRAVPVHMHAVLDTTAGAILDVWERIAAERPLHELRWSLAHLEPVSEANLDRIAALGAGVAVQDRLVYRATDSARVWGQEAVRGGPPLRGILERGIPLGAGTDATRVASCNPWVSLWWLVTGRTFDEGPERSADQCLTRVEALEAYTDGSAWFSFEEGARGRLQPGMAADFAVLSDDYFDVAEDDIRSLRSLLTVADGRVMHAAAEFGGLASG